MKGWLKPCTVLCIEKHEQHEFLFWGSTELPWGPAFWHENADLGNWILIILINCQFKIHILQPCNSFTLYGTQTTPVNMVQHKKKRFCSFNKSINGKQKAGGAIIALVGWKRLQVYRAIFKMSYHVNTGGDKKIILSLHLFYLNKAMSLCPSHKMHHTTWQLNRLFVSLSFGYFRKQLRSH